MAEKISQNLAEVDELDDEAENSTVETRPAKVVDEKKAEEEAKQLAEKEKTRHDLIEKTVSDLASGEWEKLQENQRLKERYPGFLGKFKSWMSGEHDFSYDKETGEVKSNVTTQVTRRVAGVLWRSAKTAALVAGIGLLTGGVGAIPAGVILGSALGRGTAEALKTFLGKENSKRESLVLTRGEYYKKAQDLAAKIGPEIPENISAEKLQAYQEKRNAKIKELISFVNSAEKESAAAQVSSQEKDLEACLKKWRTAEEGMAFAGGVAGGVFSLLHAKSQAIHNLNQRLESGQSLRMNIDGDNVWHNVSRIDDAIKHSRHLADNYVFHYNSGTEAHLARAAHATVLQQGQHGAHILGSDVSKGVSQLANREVWRQGAQGVLALLGDRWLGYKANKRANEEFESYQKSQDKGSKELSGLFESKKEEEKGETSLPKKGEVWQYKDKGKIIFVRIASIDGVDSKIKTLELDPVNKPGKKFKLAYDSFVKSEAKIAPPEYPQEVEIPKELEGEGKEDEKSELRQAAWYAIDKLTSYGEINAKHLKESEQKFREVSQRVWKEFAVHGGSYRDKESGEMVFVERVDLDSKVCLGLLTLAGFDTSDVKFVNPSDIETGRVVMDTGDTEGVHYDPESKTLVMDHHAPENTLSTCAASVVYETLIGLGHLKRTKTLDSLMGFLVGYDNATYQTDVEKYKKSAHNLYGLGRYMTFENLYLFFREGKSPIDEISPSEAVKFGISKKDYEKQENITKNTEEFLRGLEKQGFSLESERYGKILVDLDKRLPGSYDGARAFGYDTYIIWTPKTQSYMISSRFGITDSFAGGKKIRQNMFLKPWHDGQPLRVTLGDVLERMTDGNFTPTGDLKKYLSSESAGEELDINIAPVKLPAAA